MANRAVPLLTDRQAKLAKKTIAVGGVRGLILKVNATSLGNFSRIFQLRMTVDGKTKYFSIGPYPQISLEEARQTALLWRNKVSKGENPRQEAIEARKAKLAATEEKKTYSVQKMLLDYCEFGEGRFWQQQTITGKRISRDHSEIVNGYIRNHIPKTILSMFITTPSVVELGVGDFRLFFLSYILLGVWIVVLTLMQSLGRATKASVLVILRQIAIYIPAAIIMPYIAGFGVHGVFAAPFITDVIVFIVAVGMMINEFRRMDALKASGK